MYLHDPAQITPTPLVPSQHKPAADSGQRGFSHSERCTAARSRAQVHIEAGIWSWVAHRHQRAASLSGELPRLMIGEEESPRSPIELLQQVLCLPPFHGIRWNTVLRIFRSWAPKAGSGRYRTTARTVNPQCRHRLY